MFNPPYDAATGIPYLQLLVESIRAVAWPTEVVLVIWIFRDDLKPLLAKIESFGPSGVKISQPSQPTQSIEGDSETALGEIALSDPVAREIDQSIRNELNKIPQERQKEKLITGLT